MFNKGVILSTFAIVTGITAAQAQTVAPSTPYHLSGGTTSSSNSNLIAAGLRYFNWMYAGNPTATGAYIKLYNLAAAPTCSSAIGIVHVFPIPPNFGGFIIPANLNEAYPKGLGFCVTGGSTDTDASSAPAGIMIEGGYR